MRERDERRRALIADVHILCAAREQDHPYEHDSYAFGSEGVALALDLRMPLVADVDAEEEALMPSQDGFDRDSAVIHLFHWTLFELGCTSGSERLELLAAAAAADAATPALHPVRAALGDSADLIAQFVGVAVYMTEMFNALRQDALAVRYQRP